MKIPKICLTEAEIRSIISPWLHVDKITDKCIEEMWDLVKESKNDFVN